MLSAGAVALLVLAGCSDDRTTGPAGQEAFAKYVAIGTSLSMGVQSDGVVYFSQQHDWTKLLTHQAFAQFRQPLVAPPGCFSPLVAPLQFSRRLSGISAAANQATSTADTACAAFGTDTLPTNDVAIDGANTYDALYVTPETASVEGVKRRRQYRLVLPPKTSQVTAMMHQKPTLVSVELGANEALGAASGLLFPKAGYRGAASAGTFVPNAVWQPVYDALIDSVKKTGAKVLLVGVPKSTGFVSLRTGDELYADRAAFLNFGVIIAADCQGSANAIFVPIKVLNAVGAAQATGTAQTLTCTDAPGVQDNILTPADIQVLDGVIDGMNSHIQSVAQANGWAYLDLSALWPQWVATRGTFSIINLLGCVRPYGQFVSLDGLHPNADGYQQMANAAADALNATYSFAIPTNPQTILTSSCP
ncbi:MAG TPA: SGNH/GDSL hydrolase family protein [Gemmatimonadaceae bacterium]|nr:SGNH/GDSL hydrolase family protein [Gemmatimonadaceae bacterium]